MSLLTYILFGILSLIPLATSTITPPRWQYLSSRGSIDVAGCYRAIAEFPTGRPCPFSPPADVPASSNTVEMQSSTNTVPQNFRHGKCIVSVWPSERGTAVLQAYVDLSERETMEERDWKEVQVFAYQLLGTLKKGRIRGGRVSTQTTGKWLTVQIFSDNAGQPKSTTVEQPKRTEVANGLSRGRPNLIRIGMNKAADMRAVKSGRY